MFRPMLKPLGDRVLVKEIKQDEEKTASGIILPGQKRSRHIEGEVIEVGPGNQYLLPYHNPVTYTHTLPCSVKKGDKVMFTFGEVYTVDNEEYYILRESDILAVIK